MTDDAGDVVCVGIISRGRRVDWPHGGCEPDPVEWIAEAIFFDILRAADMANVPLLPKLDLYAQTRFGAADCIRLAERWSDLEAILEGTRAERPAAAMHRFIQICAGGSDLVELLIEGP